MKDINPNLDPCCCNNKSLPTFKKAKLKINGKVSEETYMKVSCDYCRLTTKWTTWSNEEELKEYLIRDWNIMNYYINKELDNYKSLLLSGKCGISYPIPTTISITETLNLWLDSYSKDLPSYNLKDDSNYSK